ncbi:glycoside hydrolase family 32 protein [Dolosigranulum pigrum]|uniref:glycoside hydrolase family 32 protein n=1 Tax=Dolosigranulum pigrum TaxID=29394 RepID=UPI000DD9684A|nr:glycoside hydrolase family 32 protein [Dolosigranulum pigrum]QJS98811.1 glycoside hydrolase family 32 protein [Dolosigranulum pigrum]
MTSQSDITKQIRQDMNRQKAIVDADPWRLHYHLMPEVGWLNDPNGAVQFNGTYHIYHQYVPETPNGGRTHWGHKTSQDLVHFTEEDIFLSPTESFDTDGVYSGNAFVHEGQLHFFYTGNVKQPGDHDYTYSGREQNTIHVTSTDGFSVDSREVVIPHADYPDEYTDHIRDPKVFQHEETFYMILGARKRSNTGAILLYESSDLSNWSLSGEFIEGTEDEGYMWECPDYFAVDGQDILILSPQGILPTTYQYHNPHAACYVLGAVNWDEVRFGRSTDFRELDRGFDFYAPQTFEDEHGRRIMWGWMGIGDTEPEYLNPTVARGWQHALTLPRELRVVDGELRQLPLPEYNILRQNQVTHQLTVDGPTEIEGLSGEVYEMMIQLEETPDDFSLTLRQDTVIDYRDGLLTLKHGPSGYGRRKRQIELSELTELHLFSDTSSLEIFINHGEYVLSTRVYPEPGADRIVFAGQAKLTVHKWDLQRTTT